MTDEFFSKQTDSVWNLIDADTIGFGHIDLTVLHQ